MNTSSKQDKLRKDARLPRKRGYVAVSASPFNAVKLDLAILLLLSVLAWVMVSYLVVGVFNQVLCLAGFGIISMLWLLIRTRRVLKEAEENHETQQK